MFLGFTGLLDQTGIATATLNLPLAPILIGQQVSSACISIDYFTNRLLVSNGTVTQITP
jgi:hypothetical protein